MHTTDTDLEDRIAHLSEFHRTRHFGKYRGTVADVDDPEGAGRIAAIVPAIYGQEESPWALPALPFAGAQHGLVLLPEVGDGVWIEFEGGDISLPIWTGCFWKNDERPTPTAATARLFATSAGHQILIDEDADTIALKHPGGAELTLGSDAIVLKLGACELKLTMTEITLNQGMVKVTPTGASLVNGAFGIGA